MPLAPHNGFTLIEMLVVLAIVGLVAGLAFPEMEKALGAIHQRHARAQVLAAAAGARAQALRSDAMVVLTALPDESALTLAGATGTGDARWTIDPGLRVATSPTQLRFYPDGTTTGGQIRLTAPSGTTTWTIDRDAGQLSEVNDRAR